MSPQLDIRVSKIYFIRTLKAALINLAEAIKSEMHDNLNVKLICPGFVETPATKVNSFKMPYLMSPKDAARIIYSKIYKKGFEISFLFLLIL